MKLASMGDLAQSYAFRRQTAALNKDLNRLTQQLATGETTNVSRHLGGDYRFLSDIEHRGRTVSAFEASAAEAQGFMTAMQTALEKIQSSSEGLAVDLLHAPAGTGASRKVLAKTAENSLSEIVSALNTSFAGRSLFSGQATNRTAIASPEAILQTVRLAVGAETTSEGIIQAVKDWFTDPAGFAETAYFGSSLNLSPFRLGERDAIHLDLRADAKELRDVLSEVALAAISSDYDDPSLQSDLLQKAGLNLLEDQGNLTALRADLGFAEGRIEEIGVGLNIEASSLLYAREALLGIDDAETVTKLQDAQFHLEALYTVTARLSALSLVRYL